MYDGIPICLGYVSVSFAFGLMCSSGGLSALVSVIISMTNLTSAGQFAGLDIIKSGGGLFELAFATFIINLRYLLMSLSLSQRIDPKISLPGRLIMSFGITDEIFALSMQQNGSITFKYFVGLMTLPYIGWAGGTFLGSFASSVLPEQVRLALSIAIYAMFIAIIIPPSKKSRPVLFVVLTSIAVSIALHVIPVLKQLSSGWLIIISTFIAASLGAYLYPEKEDEK